jgi:hypothetical protein
MGDKLIKLVEKVMSSQPMEKITWEEYKEDTAQIPRPTEEQVKNVIDQITSNGEISRFAGNGWKIVPFLSTRNIGEEKRNDEMIENFGYITYIILDEKGNIMHSKGSGEIEKNLPKELVENAAIIEIPVVEGKELRTDILSFKPEKGLEESMKKILL